MSSTQASQGSLDQLPSPASSVKSSARTTPLNEDKESPVKRRKSSRLSAAAAKEEQDNNDAAVEIKSATISGTSSASTPPAKSKATSKLNNIIPVVPSPSHGNLLTEGVDSKTSVSREKAISEPTNVKPVISLPISLLLDKHASKSEVSKHAGSEQATSSKKYSFGTKFITLPVPVKSRPGSKHAVSNGQKVKEVKSSPATAASKDVSKSAAPISTPTAAPGKNVTSMHAASKTKVTSTLATTEKPVTSTHIATVETAATPEVIADEPPIKSQNPLSTLHSLNNSQSTPTSAGTKGVSKPATAGTKDLFKSTKRSRPTRKTKSSSEADAPVLFSKEFFDNLKEPSKRSGQVEQKENLQEFIEPPLAEPVVTATGLPLHAFPTHKIKKERLWNPKKGKRGRPSEKNPPVEEETTPEVELPIVQVYKANLKTRVNEKLQKSSSIRSATTPTPKKSADIYGLLSKKISKTNSEPPLTPNKRKFDSDKLEKKTEKEKEDIRRKIKNASPKKARPNAFGFETKPDPSDKSERSPKATDTTKDNDDFCSSCGEPGIFLCCESCPKSFHFACCDPPFYEDNLPEEEWFCNECSAKKNPPKVTHAGMFCKLLDQIPLRNPTQFRLPKNIRERFEGVVTGSSGEYEDTDYKAFNPARVYAFDQTDPALHFDKDGNPKICVKCGESGIHPNKVNGGVDKLIIQCEYCPSAWHLDCLSPPLSTVKQLGTKWKCPNHADHLIVNKQRRLKKAIVVDVDHSRGYKNNGQIEIKSDSEEPPESSSDEDDTGDSDDESENEIQDIPTPPELQNHDTEDGVGAELSPKVVKRWTDPLIIPRLSERGVVLDFIGKCVDTKAIQREKINEILRLSKENNELLSNIGRGYNDKEQKTIKSLIELKELDFQELLDVVNEESSARTCPRDQSEIDNDELEELRKIRELMKAKGKKKTNGLFKK